MPARFPPHWAEVDDRLRHGLVRSLRFSINTAAGDVNRFAHRYRFTTSFAGLVLDGLSDGTRQGYEELTRVSLWWSVIERQGQILGFDGGALPREFGFDSRPYIDRVRGIPGYDVYIRAARAHVDKRPLQNALDAFLVGSNDAPLCIARAIRHIYLHGSLTPGAGGIQDGGVASHALCQATGEFAENVVDYVWSEHLRRSGII